MNRNQWTKITEFRMFGLPILQKIESSNEKNFDDEEIIQINVRPDYFKQEFE